MKTYKRKEYKPPPEPPGILCPVCGHRLYWLGGPHTMETGFCPNEDCALGPTPVGLPEDDWKKFFGEVRHSVINIGEARRRWFSQPELLSASQSLVKWSDTDGEFKTLARPVEHARAAVAQAVPPKPISDV